MSNLFVELSNSFTAATEKAGKSTVLINARHRMPASGVAISAELVITADHIIEHEDDIVVILADGTELKATLAGRDPASDLAVLRLEKAAAYPAEKAGKAKVGQLVLALGRPSAEGIEASLGAISAISGPVRTQRGLLDSYYRTDTTPYPGFSGGPLVDAEGNVLGINTSGFGRGVSITIPVETAWQIAEELAKNGSIKRGYIGIRSQPVELTSTAQTALKRVQHTGLLVVGLEPESPAETGGLLVGDTLVGINGNPVPDHDALFSALSGSIVGKSAPLEILRGGQPQTLNVTIGEHPSETEENHEHHHGHRHGRR